jgi:hypothetical protein
MPKNIMEYHSVRAMKWFSGAYGRSLYFLFSVA